MSKRQCPCPRPHMHSVVRPLMRGIAPAMRPLTLFQRPFGLIPPCTLSRPPPPHRGRCPWAGAAAPRRRWPPLRAALRRGRRHGGVRRRPPPPPPGPPGGAAGEWGARSQDLRCVRPPLPPSSVLLAPSLVPQTPARGHFLPLFHTWACSPSTLSPFLVAPSNTGQGTGRVQTFSHRVHPKLFLKRTQNFTQVNKVFFCEHWRTQFFFC